MERPGLGRWPSRSRFARRSRWRRIAASPSTSMYVLEELPESASRFFLRSRSTSRPWPAMRSDRFYSEPNDAPAVGDARRPDRLSRASWGFELDRRVARTWRSGSEWSRPADSLVLPDRDRQSERGGFRRGLSEFGGRPPTGSSTADESRRWEVRILLVGGPGPARKWGPGRGGPRMVGGRMVYGRRHDETGSTSLPR